MRVTPPLPITPHFLAWSSWESRDNCWGTDALFFSLFSLPVPFSSNGTKGFCPHLKSHLASYCSFSLSCLLWNLVIIPGVEKICWACIQLEFCLHAVFVLSRKVRYKHLQQNFCFKPDFRTIVLRMWEKTRKETIEERLQDGIIWKLHFEMLLFRSKGREKSLSDVCESYEHISNVYIADGGKG